MIAHGARCLSYAAVLLCSAWLTTASHSQDFAENASDAQAPLQLGDRHLQQIALTTRDLPRAVEFYRDILELRLLFESNGMAFFDVGGMRLMIAHDPQRPQGRPTSVIYFDVPNFQTALASLRAREVELEGPVEIVQRTTLGELKLQQFRDPDGNALAIMALVPPASVQPHRK